MTSYLKAGELTAQVDSELRSILAARDMPLYRMMSYHMGWGDARGGDERSVAQARTHGVLCLLACRASGGSLEAALPAAAAVELVHNFCLIHDDVQGGNPQRGKRDAVWWVWGPAQAINAGDGMHALARLALFRLLQRGVPPATTFRAVQLLDEASLRTCEGRFLDLEAQEQINVDVASYLKTVSSKTGALVACAMKLGALVSRADEATLENLETCGTKLGVTMQMQADLRELWGSEGEDSTPTPEVMNKKKLLPVVYALEHAAVRDKRRLGDIYFKRVLEPDDVARLRQVVEELGARDGCEKLVAQYRAGFLAALEMSGIPPQGRSEIQAFAEMVLR